MDLVFYVRPGWQPLIRPASPTREWMENSPERFAYRCLPLAIANAHGWEVLSPCGFSARWNGRSGTDGVEIQLDEGTKQHQAPTSLFGEGTFTFHIEAIVRTPPGWNLWVGGPPNDAKDGLAPLSAVVETDWSSYSFTMNWRFTRPNHWIRFEAGEPFCFLFPVQRAALNKFEPTIRPMSEAPEIGEQFTRWSESRDAFQKWVAETQPAKPTDRWQKLYYRGLNADGTQGAADHQAKLRLATPELGQGVTIDPPRCPARPAAADTPSYSEPPKAAATAEAGAEMTPDRALAHREWLLATAAKQQRSSPAEIGLDVVRDITSDEFVEHFYARSLPVVIQGEVDDWPALRRWTPGYLRDRLGSVEIEYQGDRASAPDFELFKDNYRRTMPFDSFIDSIQRPGSGNDAYITAYNSSRNSEALAPLRDELGTLDKFLTSEQGMMWIGPKGTFTPLHFDLTNNLLVQLVGRKRLVLSPPSETARLAHHRHVFSAIHDLEDADCLQRYPAASQAQCFEVELSPGDILYVPVGWWHQVRALDFSVMLTYTNFLWPNDAHAGFPDLE